MCHLRDLVIITSFLKTSGITRGDNIQVKMTVSGQLASTIYNSPIRCKSGKRRRSLRIFPVSMNNENSNKFHFRFSFKGHSNNTWHSKGGRGFTKVLPNDTQGRDGVTWQFKNICKWNLIKFNHIQLFKKLFDS